MRRLPTLLILLATFCALGGARAEEPQYDQVEFGVQTETELQNDLAELTLAAEAEHPDPAQVAAEINRAMGWALGQARGVAEIKAQSGNYETYPVYDKTRLLHWRGSQTLLLRSRDVEALNTLAGRLQQRLQVKGMRFTVAPATQRAVETQLVDRLMEDFKQRAERIQQGLGAKGYRIVRLQIDGGAPPPVMARTVTMMEKDSVPVAGEAGSSQYRLGVHAVIQLQF